MSFDGCSVGVREAAALAASHAHPAPMAHEVAPELVAFLRWWVKLDRERAGWPRTQERAR